MQPSMKRTETMVWLMDKNPALVGMVEAVKVVPTISMWYLPYQQVPSTLFPLASQALLLHNPDVQLKQASVVVHLAGCSVEALHWNALGR